MTKTFSSAFIEYIETTGMKVTDIAKASGVSKDALYSLKYGKSQNMGVDDAIRVTSALGMTVEEFMGIAPREVRQGLTALAARLAPREQELLEASLKAILDAQHSGTDEGKSDV